jgi:hypothetical protein
MDRDPTLEIVFGSVRFDPLERETDLPEEDNEPSTVPTELLPWFVQFREPLTADEISRLRRRYSLRLTDFVPNLAYVERLHIQTVQKLRTEPVVRAVAAYTSEMKVAPTLRRSVDDNRFEAALLNAVLFDDGDPDRVRDQLARLGARSVAVLDDRPLGGRVMLRFFLPVSRVNDVSEIQEIRWIEPVPEIVDDAEGATPIIQAGTPGMISALWDVGLHGEGQIIGVIDNGPPDIRHCFFRDAVDNTPGPAHRKIVAVRNARRQLAGDHSTFVAGCAAGDSVDAPGAAPSRGGAWASKLVIGNRNDMIIFGNPAKASATTLFSELAAAARAGATIHSNSWHARPAADQPIASYDLMAADVDSFTWSHEEHIVLGSSGNSGEHQGPPGTSKNAICVAAATGNGRTAGVGDGASGPTADGRRKPDLMFVGCAIHSAIARTPCESGPRSPCASSYATPYAAAAGTLIRQYFSEGWYPSGTRTPEAGFTPSGALLKAVLVNSTTATSGISAYPSDSGGWGLVQLRNSLWFGNGPRRLRVWDIRNANGLSQREGRTYSVRVNSSTEPFHVTLVWTEPPATPGTVNPVVNNLDLEVTSPGGESFVGNALLDGVSVSRGTPDSRNNVEVVLIDNPPVGDWTISVRAVAVNVGNPGQGFAMTASGNLR